MSFLNELKKQKSKLKDTEMVVTNADGTRYIEKSEGITNLPQNPYGFVVDTKPDDVPALITDHLYIGSQDCTSKTVLDKYDIRSVLSVGIEVQIDNVTCKFASCLDLPETDIRPVLDECLPFVRENVKKKQNVLIHCNAGVSRTSMVAIAYLMHFEGLVFDEAYSLVKSKRPAIQPNAGFRTQLNGMRPGQLRPN